jgi:hypothetical protein
MNLARRPSHLSLLAAFAFGSFIMVTAQGQTTDPAGGTVVTGQGHETTVDYALFKESPRQYRGHAWFTFNLGALNDETVLGMVRKAVETDSYGGFMITPSPGGGWGRRGGSAPTNPVTYLNDEFFRLYKVAIEEGLKHGLPMDILYDELQFPTGMAGGLFAAKYPEDIQKSLEIVEKDVVGPAEVELAMPAANSMYVGMTMMNLDTRECVDVTDRVGREGAAFKVRAPQGEWKVMLFYLDTSRGRGVCDYLSAKAVDGLIEVMYDRYYEKLKEYFGTMIKMSFYDEPSLHNSVKGRMWTPDFNEAFKEKHGYSPLKYYPALWYDIGPETAAARNALFGFRAELYTENFIGRLAAWCDKHGIALSGHMDQEEAPNPVGTQGDLMKIFKHQHVPTIDDIWFTGRSNTSYKIVTSAAFNYDRPIIQAETYAAYQRGWQDAKAGYRTAMDQHAMGINQQVGNRLGDAESPEMGRYVGRMEYLLRYGRHVADIAVLYPIATLQAKYRFAQPVRVEPVTGGGRRGGEPGFYFALEGGIMTPENDYMELGEMLFRGLRIDYTYLHPEVLEGKCMIDGNQLVLDNKVNREAFRVLLVPGCETISVGTAEKIRAFYRAGGTVIATGVLPRYSAEFKRDREVQKIIGEVFGVPEYGPMTAAIRAYTDDFRTYFAQANEAGGRAYFLPRPFPKMLTDVLNEAVPVRDVMIRMAPAWPLKMHMEYAGALTYIHKVKGGRDIYFFANSTDAPVETDVVVRGGKNLAIWDPHTGERRQTEAAVSETGGQAVTTFRLALQPLKSLFYVQE